jgi:hypothetical protein
LANASEDITLTAHVANAAGTAVPGAGTRPRLPSG